MGLLTRRRTAPPAWEPVGDDPVAEPATEAMKEGGCAGGEAWKVYYACPGRPGARIAAWFYPVGLLGEHEETFGVGVQFEYRCMGGRWTFTGHEADPGIVYEKLDDASEGARAAAELVLMGMSLRPWQFLGWDGQPW